MKDTDNFVYYTQLGTYNAPKPWMRISITPLKAFSQTTRSPKGKNTTKVVTTKRTHVEHSLRSNQFEDSPTKTSGSKEKFPPKSDMSLKDKINNLKDKFKADVTTYEEEDIERIKNLETAQLNLDHLTESQAGVVKSLWGKNADKLSNDLKAGSDKLKKE